MQSHYYINWDDATDIPATYPPEVVLQLFFEEFKRRTNSVQGAAELLEQSILQTPVPVIKILQRNTKRMEARVLKIQRYLEARKNIQAAE